MEMNFSIKISTQVMLNEITNVENPERNMVTSPMSTNLILNMLTVGTVGYTNNQLMNALEIDSIDEINCVSSSLMMLANSSGEDGGPIVSMVNGMWSDLKFPFIDSYRQLAVDIYRADIRSVDFQDKEKLEQVRQDVNAWAEKETKGLIKELIAKGKLKPDARIVKANALYFKGTWLEPFKQSNTRNDHFYLLNGQTVEVPFLASYHNQYYRCLDDFKLLRLPYKSGDDKTNKFSMYVFLPNEKDGLENLLKRFNSDPSLIHTKCDQIKKVDWTWIPKFQILFDFKPSKIMKRMGINLPFEPMGELTNMVDSKRIAVSKIYQKSYVEVNEEGTEAASVTEESDEDMGFSLDGPPPPPPITFVADHPFVFSIKEDISGAVLFIGAVVNPLLPVS